MFYELLIGWLKMSYKVNCELRYDFASWHGGALSVKKINVCESGAVWFRWKRVITTFFVRLLGESLMESDLGVIVTSLLPNVFDRKTLLALLISVLMSHKGTEGDWDSFFSYLISQFTSSKIYVELQPRKDSYSLKFGRTMFLTIECYL